MINQQQGHLDRRPAILIMLTRKNLKAFEIYCPFGYNMVRKTSMVFWCQPKGGNHDAGKHSGSKDKSVKAGRDRKRGYG